MCECVLAKLYDEDRDATMMHVTELVGTCVCVCVRARARVRACVRACVRVCTGVLGLDTVELN